MVDVEHVKEHRTKKDKIEMSHFERFVTEGNEKADELAKAGAMMDEGFMAEARRETVQQEREDVFAALQYAASFHCLVEEKKDCEELKPKLSLTRKMNNLSIGREWCAQAKKYRCMRCGKGSKCMKMPRQCTGPRYLSKNFGKCGKRHLGGHDLVRRVDRQGQVIIWCKKLFGLYKAEDGPKLMICCMSEQVGTKEHGKTLKRIKTLEDGRVPAKEATNWEIEGPKRRITRKEYQRLLNKFEMEVFMAQTGLWNLAKIMPRETEVLCRKKKVTPLESLKPCTKKIS